MFAEVKSFGLIGLDGVSIRVEVDSSFGMPNWDLVGLPDLVVKESKERVRLAIKNSGLKFPTTRITVNLAPADVRKEGPMYDLPIAVGVLAASEELDLGGYERAVFMGELSLDGAVRGINGILPMCIAAREQGIKAVVVPAENADEAAYVEGIYVLGVSSLADCVEKIASRSRAFTPPKDFTTHRSEMLLDISEVKGQSMAKRALEVAVAGGHNLIFIGPPGSGKSMLAKCIPSIQPKMSFSEALETTKIHSISGELHGRGIVTERPFRAPHYSASMAAITGGGAKSKPGEVSLAHNGVLFLDELPEFRREVLESLRAPLEDGVINVVRVNAKCTYPANFMLVAAMNPCPCGNFGSTDKPCKCTEFAIQRYLAKISGPLLDRIDIHIEVARPKFKELRAKGAEENSATVRARTQAAREIQSKRYADLLVHCNAQLTGDMVTKYCAIDAESEKFLKQSFIAMKLSARSYKRILLTARTIADLEGVPEITISHLAEAVGYRALDRKYWNN